MTSKLTSLGDYIVTRFEVDRDLLIEHITIETPAPTTDTQRMRLRQSWEHEMTIPQSLQK